MATIDELEELDAKRADASSRARSRAAAIVAIADRDRRPSLERLGELVDLLGWEAGNPSGDPERALVLVAERFAARPPPREVLAPVAAMCRSIEVLTSALAGACSSFDAIERDIAQQRRVLDTFAIEHALLGDPSDVVDAERRAASLKRGPGIDPFAIAWRMPAVEIVERLRANGATLILIARVLRGARYWPHPPRGAELLYARDEQSLADEIGLDLRRAAKSKTRASAKNRRPRASRKRQRLRGHDQP